jgi:hypothetical protein
VKITQYGQAEKLVLCIIDKVIKMQKKNFITTTDAETANKLMLGGFKLMSKSGNVYTFLNQPPKTFSFESVDSKKIAYTNILSM